MSERKLEPTPGWCERAYDAVKHGYVNHDLVREYEAAQEPRTYTAAEAEKLCRERPEDVIVFSPRHAFIKGSSPFEYRFNGTCFQFRIADESTCAWENYGIGLSIEREPFTIREVTQAEPLPHEIVSTSGYEKFHCMHCARPVGWDNSWVKDACPARAAKPESEKPAEEKICCCDTCGTRLGNGEGGDDCRECLFCFFKRTTRQPEKPADENFTCPKCGSPYFGRDTALVDGKIKVLDTVRCHGDSSGGPKRCDWHGVWPVKEPEKPANELPETVYATIVAIAEPIAQRVAREELAAAKVEWVTGYGPIIKPREK